MWIIHATWCIHRPSATCDFSHCLVPWDPEPWLSCPLCTCCWHTQSWSIATVVSQAVCGKAGEFLWWVRLLLDYQESKSNNKRLWRKIKIIVLIQAHGNKPNDVFYVPCSIATVRNIWNWQIQQGNYIWSSQEGSKKYTTINAHCGMYQYTRLPFGAFSTSAIFQKAMDEILQGLPNFICYLHDILVTGASDQDSCTTSRKCLRGWDRMAFIWSRPNVLLCQNPSYT